MKRCFSILSALFLCAGSLLASDVTANFSAANQLYAEGKFSEAAKGYDAILRSGALSPNLLFNQGNAEFKSGNLGSAIAAYRHAALLAPRDADIRANLEFARNQVQGPTVRENRWQSMLGSLTLNEWTALAAIAFWLALGLFVAMQLRPALKNALRGPARAMAIVAIFFCACLGVAINVHSSKPVAVVISSETVARSGPFNDALDAFAVHDGAELPVLNRRDGWVQISDGVNRTGWVQSGQVKVLPAI